jgi:hypothetical protein
MEKNITKLELLEQYKRFNYCLYHSGDNTLFKNCEQSRNKPPFLSERISFVNDLPSYDGYTHPLSVLKEDDQIYGYEMPYFAKAKSFFDLLVLPEKVFNSTMSFPEKKEMLLKLHKTLRKLNREYIVGDINLHNILITKEGQGVLVDWENGRPINSFMGVYALYFIKQNGILQDDALKLFIASISLIYGIDFESMVIDNSFFSLLSLPFQKAVLDYIDSIIDESASNVPMTVYFDEFLKYMKEPSHLERKRIKAEVSELCPSVYF